MNHGLLDPTAFGADLWFAAARTLRPRQVDLQPEAVRRLEFFRAWTRPEALLKPAGVGLAAERADCPQVDLADSARRTDPQTFNLNQPNLSRSVRL